MPSSFNIKTSRSVGTSFVTIDSYVVAAGVQTTVIGLEVANTLTGSNSATSIYVDAVVNDGAADTYIIRNAEVPGGSALVMVGGDQKIVLPEGYSIKVKSDTASSADVIMSILELTQ